jgi:hypothetical protein
MVLRAPAAHNPRGVQDDAISKGRVKVIRVVIGNVPRIPREIIEGAVRLHSDIELFRSSDADLSRAVAHYHTDAAIVAAPAPTMKRLHRPVLVDNPELKMFVVTNDGREAYLLHRTTVREVSPSGLIDAIRLAVATTAGDNA